MEKSMEKKVSMCITESLCCAETNTTLYIKYTSIKWMKKNETRNNYDFLGLALGLKDIN